MYPRPITANAIEIQPRRRPNRERVIGHHIDQLLGCNSPRASEMPRRRPSRQDPFENWLSAATTQDSVVFRISSSTNNQANLHSLCAVTSGQPRNYARKWILLPSSVSLQ